MSIFARADGELRFSSQAEARAFEFVSGFLWSEYSGYFNRLEFLERADKNEYGQFDDSVNVSMDAGNYFIVDGFDIVDIYCEKDCSTAIATVDFSVIGKIENGVVRAKSSAIQQQFNVVRSAKGKFSFDSLPMPFVSRNACFFFNDMWKKQSSYIKGEERTPALVKADQLWSQSIELCKAAPRAPGH
jgi:hypothetical protein